ncbi:APC family permease, partial [Francisella tularensis subsp. holarctica]|nr:APC family permease [Francisella tularensis subsp. holarctica]
MKTEELSLMPFGFKGVLAAVSVGGIAYAFTGFKSIVELAGSTKNPKKSIPVATVGAVWICLIRFLGLQWAYWVVMSMCVHNPDWHS